jgi:hypothetical protein
VGFRAAVLPGWSFLNVEALYSPLADPINLIRIDLMSFVEPIVYDYIIYDSRHVSFLLTLWLNSSGLSSPPSF